jgi:hypothetical protein
LIEEHAFSVTGTEQLTPVAGGSISDTVMNVDTPKHMPGGFHAGPGTMSQKPLPPPHFAHYDCAMPSFAQPHQVGFWASTLTASKEAVSMLGYPSAVPLAAAPVAANNPLFLPVANARYVDPMQSLVREVADRAHQLSVVTHVHSPSTDCACGSS